MTLAFMTFGFLEMLVIGVVALLVFGGNLPDVMRSLGQAYGKFRHGLQEFSRPVREEMRKVTQLPDELTVPRGDDEAVPTYPEYGDDEEEEDETDASPPSSSASSMPELDEPPPV